MNSEVNPCCFLYACNNLGQWHNHWDAHWGNKRLQMVNVDGQHLAWTMRYYQDPPRHFLECQIECHSNRLTSDKWPNESFGGVNHDFWEIQGWWCSHMRIFHSPNVAVLLIDEAVQRKVYFIGDQMFPKSIVAAYSCCSIAFASVSHTLMAAELRSWWVWILYENREGCGTWYIEWTCVVVYPELVTHRTETSSYCCHLLNYFNISFVGNMFSINSKFSLPFA